MAVMSERLRVHMVKYGTAREDVEQSARRPSVRPIMVVSVGLILAGMGLVALMILDLVPVSFFTAFIGFALTATGGTMALIFCGEI